MPAVGFAIGVLQVLSYFKVGPYNMENVLVIIVSHTGESLNYSGLLGMNFLKNVQYSIDYQNQMIHWKMPQTEPQTEGSKN